MEPCQVCSWPYWGEDLGFRMFIQGKRIKGCIMCAQQHRQETEEYIEAVKRRKMADGTWDTWTRERKEPTPDKKS